MGTRSSEQAQEEGSETADRSASDEVRRSVRPSAFLARKDWRRKRTLQSCDGRGGGCKRLTLMFGTPPPRSSSHASGSSFRDINTPPSIGTVYAADFASSSEFNFFRTSVAVTRSFAQRPKRTRFRFRPCARRSNQSALGCRHRTGRDAEDPPVDDPTLSSRYFSAFPGDVSLLSNLLRICGRIDPTIWSVARRQACCRPHFTMPSAEGGRL
jgi:hypothetical protein